MIVFTVDPGATSGWAFSDPGYSMSGAIDHQTAAMEAWWEDKQARGMKSAWAKLPKEERLKRVLGTYVLWLEGALRYYQPSLLVVERPSPRSERGSIGYMVEFRGATLGVAGRLDLALVECWPAQWRKHLAGRAYDSATDHQIAAEMMLAWWQTDAA